MATEQLVVNVNLGPWSETVFVKFQMKDISLAGNLISWQSTERGEGCNKYTYRTHVFLMRILSACLSQLVVTVVLQVTVISFTH